MLRLLQSRTAQLVGTRGVYLVSWFLLLAFLVRRLEDQPEENDRLALGFLWLQIGLVILDFGTGEFFTRRLALGMTQGDAVYHGVRARLVVLVALGMIAIPLVGRLYPGADERGVIGWALVAAAVRSFNEFAESILVAVGETARVLRFALAQGLATLAGGWLAVHWTTGVSSPVPFVFALLTLAYVALGAGRFWSLAGPGGTERLAVTQVLRGCLPFAGMSIAATLGVAAPGLLLSVWGSPVRDLKSFNGASRMWVAALALAQGVFARLYPEFCRLGPRRDPALGPLVIRHVQLLNLAGGLAAAVVALLSGWIVRTCYAGALPRCESLLLLLFGVLPLTVSALVPGAWLPASQAERTKTLLVAALAGFLWIALPLLGRGAPDHLLVAVFGGAWLVQSAGMWGCAVRTGLPWPGWAVVGVVPALSWAACWSRLGAPWPVSLLLVFLLLASLAWPLRALAAAPQPSQPC
ncbi:MAG: hypothetical protein ACKO3N_01585 [Verrucomicrobiota bacterium]